MSESPVAWRVTDFADGWIYFDDRDSAVREARPSGALIQPLFLAGPRSKAAQEDTASCDDCARPYGDENGFPDLIIPLSIWERISPTKDRGGLLCPSCICKRLHDAGISEVEAAFMSGPIHSVSRATMYALRRVENLERRLEVERT